MEPRYEPLSRWLSRRNELHVTLSFHEIERIIGGQLPPSARTSRSWWGNDVTHTHAGSWLSRGYKVASVSLQDETVAFQWSRKVQTMGSHNAMAALVGALGGRRQPRLSITDMKQETSALERDRLAFEATCEGLRHAGSAQIVFHARVHEPSLRGRRTEKGYATIVIREPDRPAALLQMCFADGRVTVVRTLAGRSLRAISRWPTARELAGLQFVGLWQLTQRFLVAWPTAEWQHEDDVQLIGAFVLSRSVTPAECLRVCIWLLREASVFEGGLRKVLTRERAMWPMRALRLANKHLARYVRPPDKIAKSLHRVWTMNPLLFIGADESPVEALRETFGYPFAES